MDLITNETLYSISGALTFLSTISILMWYKERTSEVLTIAIVCFGILTMDWVTYRLLVAHEALPELIRHIWFLCWGVMSGLTILTCCCAHGLTQSPLSRFFKRFAILYISMMALNFMAHLCRFYFGEPPYYQLVYSYGTLVINYFVFTLIVTKTLQTHWQLRHSMIHKICALMGKEELQ